MATLQEAASRAQDLYYQDYAPRDAFFDIADFKYHFANIYSEMFDTMFQKMRKEGKAEDGFSNVEISSAWLYKEKIDLQEDKNDKRLFTATLSSDIFAFGFDEFVYSLDIVKIIGDCKSKNCRLQKIARMDSSYLDLAPTTGLCYYWESAGNEVTFTDNVGQVLVPYVPRVSASKDNCVLSDNIAEAVIRMTLDLFFRSKAGNVVDQTNDSNNNNTLPLQTNPQLPKLQQ